jgi:hypothetical protein
VRAVRAIACAILCAIPWSTVVMAGTPARQVQILLVGPQPARRDLEGAIRTVLGQDPDLSWAARDMIPVEVLSAAPRPGQLPQLWIDVTDPLRVRILVPARTPAMPGTVRIVDSVASSGPGHEAALRETVSQIVSATVWTLRNDGAGRSDEVALAATQPPPLVPARADIPEANVIRAPVAAPVAIHGRYSLAGAVGAHTSPFLLAEPHTESHWLGLSMAVAGRWESPVALFSLRATGELSERSIDQIELRSQMYSVSLAASRKLTFGRVSFALGLEVGALFLRQHTSQVNSNSPIPASLALPGQLGTTWSVGPLVGLTGEVNLALTQRTFLHLTAGLPLAFMRVDDNGPSAWQSGLYTQALCGAGAYL